MVVERFDIAQDLARLLELLTVQHLAAHHETHGAARVHHVAADAAVQVFLASDVTQHFTGERIGHVAREHLLTDLLQFVVDVFQRVGRVFGIGIEQLQQHFLGILDQARGTARAHAEQAKHRHIFIVDRKQHAAALEFGVVLVQDEGDAHRTGVFVVVDQKVAANVHFAVVFFIEARRLLDVLVHCIFGDGQAVILLDPAFFLDARRFQVNPDRLELGQFFQRLDLFLDKSAIGERKDVEHDSLPWIFFDDGEQRQGALSSSS